METHNMQQASQASTDVRLPRAIREQSARIAEMTRPQADPDKSADAATPPQAAAVAPSTTVTLPSTPQPPADPRHSDPAYWEQRFRVTQGKLNEARQLHAAEIEGMELRVSELETQVSALEQENVELKSRSSPSSSKIDLGQFLTPEDIERIGEDEAMAIVQTAIKAAETAVKAAVVKAPAPASATSKPQSREDRDRARGLADRKRVFVEQLEELVPDYEVVDQTDGWKAWLAELATPEIKGSTDLRQDVLDRYIAAFNAQAVAGMFETYKAKTKLPDPPVTGGGDGGQNEGGPEGRPDASALRPLTKQEIKSFYTRAALGKVSDEERARFEARRKLPA